MKLKCTNCNEIFEATSNQAWTINKVIENKLLDVPLSCNACGKKFIIDPERIFDFSIDKISKQRKDRGKSIIEGDKIKIGLSSEEINIPVKYRSDTLSLMKVNDIVINKTNTTSDFKYTLVNDKGSHIEAVIEVVKSSIDYGLDELNEYQGILNKINSPKNRLHLEIDVKGGIVSIINRKEVEEKWEKVRIELENDELFSQFASADKKKILETAYLEYRNLNKFSAIVNQGYSIYAMLFSGFWGEYILKEEKMLQSLAKQSTIFKDVNVPIEFDSKLKRFDSDLLTAQIEIEGIENSLFNFRTLDSAYKEAFPFAKNELEKYNYDILMNYEFDAFRGNIQSLNMTVIEAAGDVEMFLDCKLKKLKDEEGNITQ